MIYILYEEIAKIQSETDKKKGEVLTYLLEAVGSAATRDIANAWINRDSLRRSWSESD
jgi:hypothetical protein